VKNLKNKLKNLQDSIFRNSVTKKAISNKEIKKLVKYGTKLGFSNKYDHYKDKYWNNLDLVQKYICKKATDNENTIWQVDILSRFEKHVPFNKVLIIGCGNGWVERQLYDLKVGLHFDAFDISDSYLETARKLVEKRDIRYFKADINNLENLNEEKYDAVFNVGVLHHTFRLARTLWTISKSFKKNGFMFNFDYVGPAQNQYSDEHLEIMEEINKKLPTRFQTSHTLRPAKENFDLGDPSEAVNSDLVKPIFRRFFDVIYERDLGGGVAYQILWNNIDEFEKNDEQAQKTLQWLLEMDKKYTLEKKVPNLFWYSIGTPKTKGKIKSFEILE